MKSYNEFSLNEEDLYEHDVMAFFNCNKELAQTIIKSSRINGKINSIKKMCHDCQENKLENRKGK